MKNSLVLFLVILLCGCASDFAAMQGKKEYHDLAVEELRIEVADIKHTLSTQQMEISLLEEKIREKDNVIHTLSKEASGKKPLKFEQILEEFLSLERKVGQIERIQEKMTSDLRQLNVHANQATTALGQHREKMYELEKDLHTSTQKIEELAKLKNTLNSISKAMQNKSSSSSSTSTGSTTYRVKTGDTLGKIAMEHRISVETLKKYNDLENDRIFVGKELKIPYAE